MPRLFFSISNLSIKHRLPLLIGSLLLGIIMVLTLASYRGVRQSALEVGAERLQNVTQQLANSSQQSTALLLAKTFTAANDPAIRAFLQSPSRVTRPEAATVLQQFDVNHDPNSLRVELWDSEGNSLLILPEGASPYLIRLETEFAQSANEPYKTVGSVHVSDDGVSYPSMAAVKDETGKPLGYLVRWRRLASTSDPQVVRDLLGSDASIYFGNIKGDVWTNLVRPVHLPPQGLGETLTVTHYLRDGNSVMALGRPIAGTPFFLVVEFPDHVLLRDANKFLRRVVLIDAALLMVGMLAAFALSRGITHPLQSLTRAASAISAGDYSRVVNVAQRDELGVLADAFNFMVAKLSDAKGKLEEKIRDQRNSEDRLQVIIENLADGLVVSDLDGQLLIWNKAALAMHGFNSSEECLITLPELTKVFELSTLDGRILELEQWPLSRIMRGEPLTNLEVQLRRLDRDWRRFFSYNGNMLRDATGKLLVFLTISDITERKRTEAERCSLAMIVESSRDTIIGKNPDGTITSWNKAAERLYGYSAEEIIGRPISILAPPEHFEEIASILARLARGESIDHFETERVTEAGVRLFVNLTISPVTDESGAITGYSTIARDVTRRKQIEADFRSSELRYRRLFESARDGILILNNSGEITDVNPYLLEKLSLSKEETLGKHMWEIGTFSDIAESKAAFLQIQAQDYVRYDDLPLQGSDGKITHVEVVANAYLEGEKRVVQANIRDITDRKMARDDLVNANRRLETALAQLQIKTQELGSMTQQFWQASKLATMGELSASIAHELNNPLSTISLRIEILLDHLTADETTRRSLLIIAEEVDRMGRLVSNLLSFSRRSHRQVSTLDLREELSNTLDFIAYHLSSHKIETIKKFPDHLPTVQADRQILRQVFLNLITNASDAMPGGGTLTVGCRAGVMADGRTGVVIEFSDTGTGIKTGGNTGIPTGDLPKLWEPFFTTKPEGKGTGLGLSICRRAVEEHRGIIEIESAVGKGTTVRISLPATDEQGRVAA